MHSQSLGNQRGMAMVVSLLMLMALTMIGALFVMKTKTERQISGHDKRSTQALFNAEAAMPNSFAWVATPMPELSNFSASAGRPASP